MPTATAAERPAGFVLAATVLASAMAFIDGSVVTIALPVIQTEFGAALPGHAMGGERLHADARRADPRRRRARRPGRAKAHLRRSASRSSPPRRSPARSRRMSALLIAARAVQGVGAALLVPQSLAHHRGGLSARCARQGDRVWAAASAITTSLGPPLGGFVIDALELARRVPDQPAAFASRRSPDLRRTFRKAATRVPAARSTGSARRSRSSRSARSPTA